MVGCLAGVPEIFAVKLQLLQGTQPSGTEVRVGYFGKCYKTSVILATPIDTFIIAMCAGTQNNLICHSTLRSSAMDLFVTNDGDLQFLLQQAETIQSKILPFIILVAACFFGVKMICLIVEWLCPGRPWLKMFCIVKLISAYASLFLVITAASEISFALKALSFGNTLGESRIHIARSIPLEGIHWTLAAFSLMFHLSGSLHLDLHRPLQAWHSRTPFVPQPLSLGVPPPQFNQPLPGFGNNGPFPPPPHMQGMPPQMGPPPPPSYGPPPRY